MSGIINDLIYCKKTLDFYISERSSKKKMYKYSVRNIYKTLLGEIKEGLNKWSDMPCIKS